MPTPRFVFTPYIIARKKTELHGKIVKNQGGQKKRGSTLKHRRAFEVKDNEKLKFNEMGFDRVT